MGSCPSLVRGIIVIIWTGFFSSSLTMADDGGDTREEGWATKDMVYKVGGAVVGATVALSVPGLALGAMGFSGKGVMAGSLAAGIQSGIGNVASGSIFAFAQSVSAGGLGLMGKAVAAVGGTYLGAKGGAATKDVVEKSE